MMTVQWLNDQWMLRETPLDCTADQAGWIARQSDNWHQDLELPCDVHQPLIAAGVIQDPLEADACFAAEWIEQRAWWFRRFIEPKAGWQECDEVELVLESLDVAADVFFNGTWLGHHASAFYPFRRDIRPWLRDGQNELIIRLTSGLENICDADLAELDFAVSTEAGNGCPERGDKRRAFVRKPAYVFGWDWSPRIATCGIVKQAWLSYHEKLTIRDVQVETCRIQDMHGSISADLRVVVCVENHDMLATADADIVVQLTCGDDEIRAIETDLLLRSGLNFVTFGLTVEQARLWWPNGMGDQPLYTVTVQAIWPGHAARYPEFAVGIRTIRLETGRLNETRRHFAFLINERPVFCKGANWIPADAIYARAGRDKYDALVRQAKLAHFNMLRIWGGGLYEQDAFYEACDRHGILVWQDMMFSCATYPDHQETFRELVWREFDHQTRKLRNHACLALFCGNNENHWIYGRRLQQKSLLRPGRPYGLDTANQMMPEIMRRNCPYIPYWNSSPYGGAEPNDPQVGDVHHWHAAMMNPDMNRRIDPLIYDQLDAAFVSEYGYPGPPPRSSIEQYFAGRPIDRQGDIWKLHTNTFEKQTVAAGIRRHYTDRALDLDQYILYAGLVQGQMLGYSLEAMRYMSACSGALFWMYNDCWGEIGWTIVDYYLRRKIAYYAVRRALMPLRLIIRRDESNPEQLVVLGCNETAKAVTCNLQTGWVRFTGSNCRATEQTVTLDAFSRTVLTRFAAPVAADDGIAFARPLPVNVKEGDLAIIPALFIDRPLRAYTLCPPEVSIISQEDDGADRLVAVQARTFAHAVWLADTVDLELSDQYFDLLPGESRTIRICNAAGRRFAVQTAAVDTQPKPAGSV